MNFPGCNKKIKAHQAAYRKKSINSRRPAEIFNRSVIFQVLNEHIELYTYPDAEKGKSGLNIKSIFLYRFLSISNYFFLISFHNRIFLSDLTIKNFYAVNELIFDKVFSRRSARVSSLSML